MPPSDFIVDVTEVDFEQAVLFYSEKKPVVVDFWAEWCGPCRTLGPALERLAEEGRGAFRLAKLNVDSSPNLARRYSVRSIPAVKAFRGGRVVAEFVGVQPEGRLREFIRTLGAEETDLEIEKGQSLLHMRRWPEAENCFRQYLIENPRQPAARLGLVKSILLQGKIEEAQNLLSDFPESKELASAVSLHTLLEAMARSKASSPSSTDDLLLAAYNNALRLVMRGNLLGAMDGVLEVLRQDKRFRKGEARQVMVCLLELMNPSDPQTRQYRNELASILF